MTRMINFVLIALMLIGAGVVYDFKYEAERAAAKVAKINRKIDAERDAIATLKAEWSLLNQPKRLQELAERHRGFLELDPLDPTQIGSIDDIPFKPAVPVAPSTPAAPATNGTASASATGVVSVPTPVVAAPMPRPITKASVKLAQPEKTVEHTGSIGKFLDRLPQAAGKPAGPSTMGPTTTGSIPKPGPGAQPMMLAPPPPAARPVQKPLEPTKVPR
jgi:hypothetical protein